MLYAAFSLFLNAFMPCILLLALNILIITYVHRHSRVLRKYFRPHPEQPTSSHSSGSASVSVFNWRHLQTTNKRFNGSMSSRYSHQQPRRRHASAPEVIEHQVKESDIALHVLSLTAMVVPIKDSEATDLSPEPKQIARTAHQVTGSTNTEVLIQPTADDSPKRADLKSRKHNSQDSPRKLALGLKSSSYSCKHDSTATVSTLIPPNSLNNNQKNHLKCRTSSMPTNGRKKLMSFTGSTSCTQPDVPLDAHSPILGRRQALCKPLYYRPHRRSRSGRIREVQLTAMLLFVAFTLLLLTLPQYIRYLVYIILDHKSDPKTYATFVLVYHITNKLYFTNFAVNFFLYCISGSKFREDIVRLFRNMTGKCTN